MGPVRYVILAVAAVAAIGLALVVRGMMSGGATAEAVAAPVERKPMARVLVAARDLDIGARLTRADLTWQEWPLETVNAAYTTEESRANAEKSTVEKIGDAASEAVSQDGPMAGFVGAVVREPILKGDPIVARKLVRAGDSGYMAVVLPAGMRAMAVAVTPETTAGSFILPGDRVDVLVSRQIQVGGAEGEQREQLISETVLRNVKVLAIGEATKPEKDAKTVSGPTATLEVGPQDAEALALAIKQGDVSLVLRSYADVGGPAGRVARPQRVAQETSTVRVFRNGQPTDVAVMP
jgi:pilus assembly protein CpaB